MNHTYRLVRAADGTTVAVAETARGPGKGRRAPALGALAVAFAAALPAHASDWIGTGGDWFDAAKWTAGVPTAGGTFNINGGPARIQQAGAIATGAISNVGDDENGSLEISGDGTLSTQELRIGNQSTSTGTLTVQGNNATLTTTGDIHIGADGTGTLTLSNGGRVTTSQAVFLGSAQGSGTLDIGGGGAAGIISAPGIAGGGNGGIVIFNHTDTDYHFTSTGAAGGTANVLSGNLSVRLLGTGKVTLTGAHTYIGNTEVNAGTLVVNGSIQGATMVGSDGTLGGSGTVGQVFIQAGGTLAPGNSIGTLTVNGDLSFGAGSIYRVETNAAGESDRVNATGTLTINGGTVDVQAGGGGYQRNTRYTILTSGGARTGTFDAVTTNLAFLTPTLIYESNAVLLELLSSQANFVDVALTPNQRAVATYLSSFSNAPTTPLAAQLIQQIEGLSAAQARAAFDSLSGSAYASASEVARALGRNFSATLAAKTGFGNTGPGTAAAGWSRAVYASADASRYDPKVTSDTVAQGVAPRDADPGEASSGRGLWVQTMGAGGRLDTDGNGAGLRYGSSGFVLGYDQPVSGRWVAGAAAGINHSRWHATSSTAASGKLESPQAGLYARYAGDGWRLRMDATFSSHGFTTDRTVTVGAVSSTAHSRHQGREWGMAVQAETTMQMGEWQLKPVAGLRHARLVEAGFVETGSGVGNLTVGRRVSEGTLLSAGAHFARAINDGKGQLELRAVASHLAGDVDSPVTASIAGQAGSFTVAGVPLKRNALALGATATGQLARNVNAYVDANYELRGAGQSAYRLTAGVRVAF